MRKTALLLLLASILLVIPLVACSTPAPTSTPTPTPTPTPTAKPTATPTPTPTTPAKPYYEGKVIQFIVGQAAGGGSDIQARAVARYLPKYIPGEPAIVVRNMAGAGSVLAANYVYNQAPKDGTALFLYSGGSSLASLLQIEGVKFDQLKMPAIFANSQTEVHYALTKVINKGEDVMAKASQIVFAYGPMPSTMILPWALLEKVFGFETKKVYAYTGSTADIKRAILAGEINASGAGVGGYNATLGDLFKDGTLSPLWQLGSLDAQGNIVRDKAVPDVPTFVEIYEKLNGKKPSGPYYDMVLAYMSVVCSTRAGLNLPPGTENAEFTAILRDGMVKLSKDADFLKEINKAVEGTQLYYGKDAQTVTELGAKLAAPQLKPLQKWLTEGWGVKFEQ